MPIIVFFRRIWSSGRNASWDACLDAYGVFPFSDCSILELQIQKEHWYFKGKKEVYSTRYSQAVTHPSTNLALPDLTSGIGREPVFSRWYGRRQKKKVSWKSFCTSSKFEKFHRHWEMKITEVIFSHTPFWVSRVGLIPTTSIEIGVYHRLWQV